MISPGADERTDAFRDVKPSSGPSRPARLAAGIEAEIAWIRVGAGEMSPVHRGGSYRTLQRCLVGLASGLS